MNVVDSAVPLAHPEPTVTSELGTSHSAPAAPSRGRYSFSCTVASDDVPRPTRTSYPFTRDTMADLRVASSPFTCLTTNVCTSGPAHALYRTSTSTPQSGPRSAPYTGSSAPAMRVGGDTHVGPDSTVAAGTAGRHGSFTITRSLGSTKAVLPLGRATPYQSLNVRMGSA
jgi:hypothetical protein